MSLSAANVSLVAEFRIIIYKDAGYFALLLSHLFLYTHLGAVNPACSLVSRVFF